MKFAIIAAGEGSRLKQEGISVPKPLVRLHGEAMLDRLVRIFNDCQADEIVVIVNDLYPETAQHVRLQQEAKRWENVRLIVRTTPSSMHSFYEVSHYLADAPFFLLSVDTVFREGEFQDFIGAFRHSEDDGLLAVTDFVDDEKPLYVGTDDMLNVTGFHDQPMTDDRYVSGGIYALRPVALRTLNRCIREGRSRMRNFQREMIADGLQLRVMPFQKILDVDHVADIYKAEKFLSEG